MAPTVMAVASVISATASTAGAINSGYQANKQLQEQKKQSKIAEEKSKQELEKQKKKQSDMNKIYQGMKTNLYSEDVGGVSSDNLIQ